MLKTKIIFSVLLFVLSFSVYYLTTARFPVNIADSNELMTAAYANGIPHPPGYPLYQLILRLTMNAVSVGAAAFAGNITSAFFQSLSIVLLFLCILELLKKAKFMASKPVLVIASLTGSLILAFSYFFWDQATFAEVFGLHMMFTGLILLLILKEPAKDQWQIFGLFGLAAAHHQTILFLMPAYLMSLPIKRSRVDWLKNWGVFLGFFLVSYLWFLVGVNRAAPISWFFEPTLGGFYDLISRQVYAENGSAIETYSRNIDLYHSVASIWIWVKYLLDHLTLAVTLAAIGLFRLYRKQRSWGWLMIIGLLISGPLLAGYLKFPLAETSSDQIFYQGTYLRLRMFLTFEFLASLMIPVGIMAVFTKIFSYRRKVLAHLFLMAMFLVPVYLGFKNFGLVDKHDSNFDAAFFGEVLKVLPDNSLLLVDSDAVFGLLYHQAVEGEREDVLIIPTAMHMRWGYLKDKLPPEIFEITGYKTLISALTSWGFDQNRQVYVMDASKFFLSQMEQLDYKLTPYGYALEVSKQPVPLSSFDYGLSLQLAGLEIPQSDLWSRGEKGVFCNRHLILAHYYGLLGATNGQAVHLKLADYLKDD